MGRVPIVAVSVVWLTFACGGDNDRRPEQPGPPPLTAARLHELELTRAIPGQVSVACAQAARAARVRVACPKLIPDIPLARDEGLWGALSGREEPRIWMVTFTNAGGFHGRPLKGVEHWIAGGGRTAVVEKWVLSDFVHEVKGDAVLVRTVDSGGRHVRVYRFPSYPAGGPNGGHWAAFVDVGDEVVFASLHGRRYVDAAVEMAVDLARQAQRCSAAASFCG